MITRDTILKFTEDPSWSEFQTMFEDYIKVITDLKSIDLSQPATNVKAEIRVRLQTRERLIKFLDEQELLKQVSKNISPDYK